MAYLSEDDDARRTLLRNVLTQSFTEDEMAVFRAVLTDGDVEAALAAAPAGYGDAWKTGVRALLAHHNDGDIRIAMNAGSIASSGDGIRAFFGRTHDDNGAIRIDVAEGATVTGGVAGIYVENAGHGLRIEKKYTSPAVQDANEDKGPDDLLTLAEHHDQIVTVNGTVTGRDGRGRAPRGRRRAHRRAYRQAGRRLFGPGGSREPPGPGGRLH